VRKIVAFLPMRSGSQRITNKNTQDFSGVKGGLCYIKISQLLGVKEIDKIIISTNDEKVKEIARSFKSKKIFIDERPEGFSSSNTTTDALINYALNLLESTDHLLWTHTTSPFFQAEDYSRAIKKYDNFLDLGTYDSLISVKKIQGFMWDKSGPLYDTKPLKWPFTQDISAMYEIDSAIFMIKASLAKFLHNRVGDNPFFLEGSHIQTIDIDWPEDLKFAEMVWNIQGIKLPKAEALQSNEE
jgi:CMP-N-acetylneuraminic acid synthetase